MRGDFYILDSDAERARLVYACRLAEKVFLLDQTVYVHTDDETSAAAFDDLLWTFADRSFVPHSRAGDGGTVQIGCGPPSTAQVLINLSAAAPAFYDRYERVAELVDAEPTRREQGRRRFAYYRERGLKPETHAVRLG